MIPNNSPWIRQLGRKRPIVPITENTEADVVIVGGGIAGITTAYFTLKYTDKKVLLLEADKIAHGATGHNAGQITSEFEKPLSEIVLEFGEKLALEGQSHVESGWQLLDEIYTDTRPTCPLYKCTGYMGITTLDNVHMCLSDNMYRKTAGLPEEPLFIAEEWSQIQNISKEYDRSYSVIPQKNLLDLLETKNTDYIACISQQKGCLNSALFSEELLGHISIAYRDRFLFFEGSPVKTIVLFDDYVDLKTPDVHIKARKVVLCTNGFENFNIKNNAGPEIDSTFHHNVFGRIGYMSGYLEPLNRPPTTIVYYNKDELITNDPTGESYFYMTRRPHEDEEYGPHNLICAGGPEKVLPNGADYSKTHSSEDWIRTEIDDFLRQNYMHYPQESTEHAFFWHGLMGYTPNGIRRIGTEPLNKNLLYNLGCNGIGILPSIYGGKRISQILNGEKLAASIFDPIKNK